MTVYADVLIVVNLFVNYALLLCSSMIMKRHVTSLRLFIGAAVGAFYGLVIFLPQLPDVVEILMRIIASALIVFATFGYRNIRSFLRCFCTFFAVSFAFGGIMLVLWVTVAPIGMVYNNGAVYFDINLTVLAASTVVSFAVVSLIANFTQRHAPKESTAIVTVYNKGRTVTLKALIDTGNSLTESFSGYPVILGEMGYLEKVIPKVIKEFVDGDDVSASPEIRLVVHKTVSGTGVLPVFRPDYIEVKTISKCIKTNEVYIGVTSGNLASGEYEMILNPTLFDEERHYAEIAE